MTDSKSTKIECPSCGQHYTLDLNEEETLITCVTCNAEFSARKEMDIEKSQAQAPSTSTQRPPIGLSPNSPSSSGNLPNKILDRFMALMFRFGKSFSAVLAIIFLVGILISIVTFSFNLWSSIEVPQYNQIVEDGSSSVKASGNSSLDIKRDVEKRFGDDVAEIIKEHSLGDDVYDNILGFIIELDEDYQSDYVSGLDDVLSDAAKAKPGKDGNKPSTDKVIGLYSMAFMSAEAQALTDKAVAKGARWTALGSILMCSFMLFMMLVIPALLKIEENTRGMSGSN